MQTFLPYSNFTQIAITLDSKRLFNQINEAKVLIDLHDGRTDNKWKNHPAYKMWIGYVNHLKSYHNKMIKYAKERKLNVTQDFFESDCTNENIPFFLYDPDPRVILSHRSNLMRKKPDYYSQFGWKDYGINGYFWPCEVKSKRAKEINDLWDKIVKEKENQGENFYV